MVEYEFPLMIYHIAEEPKIVYDKDELETNLKDGWTVSKEQYTEAGQLKKKIEYYQEQIVICTRRLTALEKWKKPDPEPNLKNYHNAIAPEIVALAPKSPTEEQDKKRDKKKPKRIPTEADYKYVCDFPGCGKKFAYAVAKSAHQRSHN
jgi:hypothetical protein